MAPSPSTPAPPSADRRAFRRGFALCAALPTLAGLASFVDPTTTELGVGLVVLLLALTTPWVWGLTLVFGLVGAGADGVRKSFSAGAVAGAAVGFIVGAALLSGPSAFTPVPDLPSGPGGSAGVQGWEMPGLDAADPLGDE